jgi:flavin reductase (DIM6/NTAB) family NADH-FMN oxidoreductase RutF
MKKSIGPQTIVLPAPVLVVGTYDGDGRPNAMTAAWGGICCSRPPCLAVSLRKATYTFGNIIRRRAFTVSIPGRPWVAEADFFGLASGRDTDKFALTGLTPEPALRVDAPIVAEFPLVLECRLLHSIVLGLHTQFIGEIMDVRCEEECLDERGLPLVAKVDPVAYAPAAGRYYASGSDLGGGHEIGRRFMAGSQENR